MLAIIILRCELVIKGLLCLHVNQCVYVSYIQNAQIRLLLPRESILTPTYLKHCQFIISTVLQYSQYLGAGEMFGAICHLPACVVAGCHPHNLPCGKRGYCKHAPHQHSHCSYLCMCRLIWGLNYQKCNGRQNGEDLSGHFEL